MTVVADDGDHLVVEGPLAQAHPRDLGYVRLDVDDWFVEHYWRSAWYSIKEIRGRSGRKGWYCDVARPVVVREQQIYSDDLYLDVWVAADRSDVRVLDEDEFEASGLVTDDPAAAQQAQEAVAVLLQMVSNGEGVFAV
jgi:predicted RNA-binding protein associated with RNAse of E/G family